MKKNKQLEIEIRKLRRKKKKGELLFLYGLWIGAALLLLGLLLRVIMSIKFGFYQDSCSGVAEIVKVPEISVSYLK